MKFQGVLHFLAVFVFEVSIFKGSLFSRGSSVLFSRDLRSLVFGLRFLDTP